MNNERFILRPENPKFGTSLVYTGQNSQGPTDLPKLVAPTYTNTDEVVENVYALPAGHPGSRDRTSQGRMETYLKDRLLPTGPVADEIRGLVPDGTVEVTRRVRDGRHLTPKKALAATALSFVAFTGLWNAEAIERDITTVVQDVGDELAQAKFRLRYGSETPDQIVITPGAVTNIELLQELPARSGNAVGSAEADKAVTDAFAQKIATVIKAAEAQNDSTTTVVVGKSRISASGHASDEWGRDYSLGRFDAGNLSLSNERAVNGVDATREALQKAGLASRKGSVGIKENVLTTPQITALGKEAAKAGFRGENPITDAIKAVDRGEKTSPSLRNKIKAWITSKRGIELRANIKITSSEQAADTATFIEGHHAPEDPNRDYDNILPLFIPVPPIRRFRRIIDRLPAFKTLVLRGRGHVEWMHLYKEALTENGELKRNAAFYTRKYNHLLRDERIETVDRMDYLGHDGAERSLRMCYVDQEPSEYFMQKMRETAAIFANAQEGTIADTTNLIAIFPTESTGTSHGNPKKIGLGIDRQRDKDVLGFNMPLLGLIEIHAPINASKEELDAFFGALWTQAHEMTHSMDVKPDPVQLVRFADGSYASRNPWNDSFEDVDTQLRNLPATNPAKIEFDIVRYVVDRGGNHLEVTERVSQGDPRLSEAITTQIVGYKPTTYGSRYPLEHAAETGAGATTDLDIPFDEAAVQVPAHDGFNFARGYKPAEESLQTFVQHSGFDPDHLRDIDLTRVAFTQTTVKDDPVLHEIAERVRRTPVPRERDMIRVAGWVVDSHK